MLSQCELSPGDLQSLNPDLAGMWHDTQEEVCTERRPEILFPVRDRGVPYQGSCRRVTVRYKRKRRRPYWESRTWSYFFFSSRRKWCQYGSFHGVTWLISMQGIMHHCSRIYCFIQEWNWNHVEHCWWIFAWHQHKSLMGGTLTLSLLLFLVAPGSDVPCDVPGTTVQWPYSAHHK